MHDSLKNYIETKRKAGLADDKIRDNLIANGWAVAVVDAGLRADLGDVVPAPPATSSPIATAAPATPAAPAAPIAVVSTYTTRGLEYMIMFISMGIAATSIGLLLHNLVSQAIDDSRSGGDTVFSLASSSLVVALPIFVLLFIRLKKAERNDVTLLQDSSRKRAVQLTLLVTFLVGVYRLSSYVYSLLNSNSTSYYSETHSATGSLVHALITIGIAGGIFLYYWRDLHRAEAPQ